MHTNIHMYVIHIHAYICRCLALSLHHLFEASNMSGVAATQLPRCSADSCCFSMPL